jgi:hypothetical protein
VADAEYKGAIGAHGVALVYQLVRGEHTAA